MEPTLALLPLSPPPPLMQLHQMPLLISTPPQCLELANVNTFDTVPALVPAAIQQQPFHPHTSPLPASSDLGKLHYFLSIEVSYLSNGIHLCHNKYTLELLQHGDLLECKPCSIPIAAKTQLSAHTVVTVTSADSIHKHLFDNSPHTKKHLLDNAPNPPRVYNNGLVFEKHESVGHVMDKKTAKEGDNVSSKSAEENFKMVIGTSKKDRNDPPIKDNEAYTKNPDLKMFPKSLSGIDQAPSNEGGQNLSSGRVHTSQLHISIQKANCSGEPYVHVPVAKVIAETVALAAANKPDSSEASLTRYEPAFLKSESLLGLSAEPPEENSLAPLQVDILDKLCSKRSYHSKRYKGEEVNNDLQQEEKEENKKVHKHSRKKHQSHHSSESGRDIHKHKRHSFSKDRDSRRRHKHDNSNDKKHRHSQGRHKSNNFDDEHQPKKRHKHECSDDAHQNSRRRDKHSDSSDDEHQHYKCWHRHINSFENKHEHRSRSVKHRKPASQKGAELEEWKIYTKSNQSRASVGDHSSREASIDILNSHKNERVSSQTSQSTMVSNDLRAKIH
ncbi:suppressor of white-apricot-like protein [Pyrus ussuriensis x Pyrus communis]|uniref:Suppressor of white-apricot-like protein n=1 Tax=Pyrus ussuriensis x Pyrus communis TaxID=2448454 RepID=A0A5N5GJB5_9ROSA|nr:suppressor of white-apricot-like protein [Pyrus ussuriensis x Pyrus communis]